MKAKLFFLLTILMVLCYSGIAYAGEEIALTTYYPAPYGEYQTLSVGDTYTAPAPTADADLIVQGYVGIATDSPSVELDVIGDIEYTGTITDVSDERLKENIVGINDAISKIQGINGVYFNMIGSDKRELGVIAQNVQKTLPEAVSVVDSEKGYLGVDYTSLVPVLIEAIKEQQEQINELRAKMEGI